VTDGLRCTMPARSVAVVMVLRPTTMGGLRALVVASVTTQVKLITMFF